VVPPQTPLISPFCTAKSRHCCLTPQPAQIRSACLTWLTATTPVAIGKNKSGSAEAHAPVARQSVA